MALATGSREDEGTSNNFALYQVNKVTEAMGRKVQTYSRKEQISGARCTPDLQNGTNLKYQGGDNDLFIVLKCSTLNFN